MPIFCEFDWPKRCMNKICRTKIDNTNNAGGNGNNATNTVPTTANDGSSNDPNRHRRRRRTVGFREKLVSGLILTYCGLQGFLPYSHFITKVRIDATHIGTYKLKFGLCGLRMCFFPLSSLQWKFGIFCRNYVIDK